jgi:hypothetical protein
MANTIGYVSAYNNMLDAVYKKGAATAILETNPENIRQSEVNPKTIYIKRFSADGLGTYSRASGYVAGDNTVAWDAYVFAMERGRKYNLDALDAIEAYTQAAELMAEIMRVSVIPEIDAYRFSKIYTLCSHDVSADLTYDTAVSAIDTGIKTLDDAEVPAESRVMFVSNNMYQLMKQSGEWFNMRVASAPNAVLSRDIQSFDGMPLIRVPSARFRTAFTFNDGTTGGQTAGGFASGGTAINFMIADQRAITAALKHVKPKMIAPEMNADADGWIFAFRLFHDLFIPANKLSGIYLHKATS